MWLSFEKIFELKETAKWSSRVDEKKNAISELAGLGTNAVSTLEEIRTVEVNDELRQLCAEAIRKAKGADEKGQKEPNGKQEKSKAAGPEKGPK
jgi:hypothetical protein